jgi:hypothetical protein
MDILERVELIKQAEKDANVANAAFVMGKKSNVDFINMFGWVYEPRSGKEHHIPVKLYPYEEDLLTWLNERYKAQEDGLVEKSRDMGVTWTVAVFWLVWHWLYDEDFDALVGSRKEDLVDNYQLDSIFGKIDYFIDHLPNFIKPVGYDKSKHRNHMKISNPENGNTLMGEATNPQFSRSGRYSAIVLDEFAFVDKSHSIWQACGDSSSVRIPVSTPNGKGNKFSELALESQIKKITLHWRLHPDKDDAWYENEKTRRTPDEIAQELDISYTRSTRGRVYGEEYDQMADEKRITHVPFDPMYPVTTSWDFGISVTSIGFYQMLPTGAVHKIDYYENSGYSIDHYMKVCDEKAAKLNYRYQYHFGDITTNKKEMGSGKTVFEIMRANGYKVIGRKVRKQDGINAAKMLMRKMMIDETKCVKFIDAIQNYHFDWDEEKMEFSPEPVHDWSSHACDEMEYFAINYKKEPDKAYTLPKKKFDPLAITTY